MHNSPKESVDTHTAERNGYKSNISTGQRHHTVCITKGFSNSYHAQDGNKLARKAYCLRLKSNTKLQNEHERTIKDCYYY